VTDDSSPYAFYSEGLGFDAFGELADDGVPEPLQFALSDGVNLMLIPTDGFGWVIGGRSVASSEQSECMVNLRAETEAGVDSMVERAHQAGGEIVTPPGEQPWGYAGAFADPDGHVWMVTSKSFPPSS
jgi:predicted lactoylglutathione lyase